MEQNGILVPTQTPSAARKGLLDYVFFQTSRDVGPEQGQALARILLALIVSLIFAAYWWRVEVREPAEQWVIGLSAAYLPLSIAYYVFVSRYRDRFLWRRRVAILTDLALLSFALFVFKQAGVALYPLFLWVAIGNGLRFGLPYLHFATAFAVLGFVAANYFSGAWLTYPELVFGLLIGLVVMPLFFLALLRQLAEVNRRLHEKIAEADHAATHDPLTGLPNRMLFEDRLTHAIANARRSGRQVAFFFIDLDSFKSINDDLGHQAADQLLRQVAARLRASLRGSDTVSRIGGDEFMVVTEGLAGSEKAVEVVERLLSSCRGYYDLDGNDIYVTWSCGVVLYPDDGGDLHTLLRHADNATSRAKEAGGNQYLFYDADMSDGVGHKLALRTELRKAIESHQLVPYYQPQVDIASGRIIGAEALVRWQHPERGLVPPGAFIGVAEQSGLIIDIGEVVLERVCLDQAAWRERGLPVVPVSVNVSGRQFMQESFMKKLVGVLARTGVPTSQLGLEMTEGVLIEERGHLNAIFDELQQMGIKLSLDDFGTGHSSLGYLKRFPINILKIDRSFIQDIPDDPNDCALVDAILAIGRSLNMGVIAEGVEDEVQRAWLLDRGCRTIQGFLVGKPMPGEDFSRLLASGLPTP